LSEKLIVIFKNPGLYVDCSNEALLVDRAFWAYGLEQSKFRGPNLWKKNPSEGFISPKSQAWEILFVT
jgi:hypothetical protein